MNPQIARLLSRHMMIEESVHADIVAIAAREARGFDVRVPDVAASLRMTAPGPLDPSRAEQAAKAEGVQSLSVSQPTAAKPYVMAGRTAVLNIWGILEPDDDDVEVEYRGVTYRWGTSYARIRREFSAALADTDVAGILLRCNSPGGDAMAVEQVAAVIFGARAAGKPVTAIADSMVASAMLYIGAQASKVYTTPGGWVGSIGTICYYADYTKYFADVGIFITAIKSHEGKDAGSPYRTMTDADRKKLQSEVDAYAAQFDAALRRGRGVDQGTVDAWKTTMRGYVGEAAVKNGLVDGVVSDVYALLAAMEKSYTNTPAKVGGAGGRNAAQAQGAQAMDEEKGLLLDPNAGGENGGGGGGGDGGAAVKEAVKATKAAERARVTGIRQRATAAKSGSFAPYAATIEKIESKAIESDMTPEAFGDAVMTALAEEAGPTGHVGDMARGGVTRGTEVSVGAEQGEKTRNAYVLSLVEATNPSLVESVNAGGEVGNRVAAAIGFDDSSSASKAFRELRSSGMGGGRVRLSQIAIASYAKAAGCSYEQASRAFYDAGQQSRFMSQIGASSSDFPSILGAFVNKTLQARFQQIPVFWNQIARKGSANDFKEQSLVSVSSVGKPEKTREGRTPRRVTLNDRREVLLVDPFASRIMLTYQTMRNDDLGVFGQQATMAAEMFRLIPDDLVYDLLLLNSGLGPTMSDGNTLFHANHGNIITSSALSYAAAEADVTAFRSTRDFGPDRPHIDIRPERLLVTVSLEMLAKRIAMNEFAPGTAASPGNSTDTNMLRGLFQVVSHPRFTGTRRWWFANPAVHAALEVAFLDGNETPEVAELPRNNPMEMEWQLTLPGVGVAAVSYEPAATNAGS